MRTALILLSIAILIMLAAIEFLKKEIKSIHEELDRMSNLDLDVVILTRTVKKCEDRIDRINKLNERINLLITLNGLKEM